MVSADWETFAWNGIVFSKPYTWEISKEEFTSKVYYVVFEDIKMRRLELKAETIPFDKAPEAKDIIDKFIDTVKEKFSDIKVISKSDINLLNHKAYEAIMRTKDYCLECIGWYCDDSERAFLLNFIYKTEESTKAKDIIFKIIKSFKCHLEGEMYPWYFQGIFLMLPKEYKPIEKKTTTGLSYLKFYHKETVILLAYNCMASVILEEEDIETWFKKRVFKQCFKKYGKISDLKKRDLIKLNTHDVNIFSYEIKVPFSPRKRKCYLSLWVCDQNNRLMCFTVVSKESIRVKEKEVKEMERLFIDSLKSLKCHQ